MSENNWFKRLKEGIQTATKNKKETPIEESSDSSLISDRSDSFSER